MTRGANSISRQCSGRKKRVGGGKRGADVRGTPASYSPARCFASGSVGSSVVAPRAALDADDPMCALQTAGHESDGPGVRSLLLRTSRLSKEGTSGKGGAPGVTEESPGPALSLC